MPTMIRRLWWPLLTAVFVMLPQEGRMSVSLEKISLERLVSQTPVIVRAYAARPLWKKKTIKPPRNSGAQATDLLIYRYSINEIFKNATETEIYRGDNIVVYPAGAPHSPKDILDNLIDTDAWVRYVYESSITPDQFENSKDVLLFLRPYRDEKKAFELDGFESTGKTDEVKGFLATEP